MTAQALSPTSYCRSVSPPTARWLLLQRAHSQVSWRLCSPVFPAGSRRQAQPARRCRRLRSPALLFACWPLLRLLFASGPYLRRSRTPVPRSLAVPGGRILPLPGITHFLVLLQKGTFVQVPLGSSLSTREVRGKQSSLKSGISPVSSLLRMNILSLTNLPIIPCNSS